MKEKHRWLENVDPAPHYSGCGESACEDNSAEDFFL